MSKARPGADAINPASDEEAIEVGPGMWMSHGLSNSYLVSTDAGRIIVNTGVPFESLLHRQLFDAVDSSPTIYIVVTQGHPDHFGGVDTFKEPGTDVIAQANWPTWRDEHYLGRLDGFRARAGFAWQDKLRAGMALAAERFGRPLPSPSESFRYCKRNIICASYRKRFPGCRQGRPPRSFAIPHPRWPIRRCF